MRNRGEKTTELARLSKDSGAQRRFHENAALMLLIRFGVVLTGRGCAGKKTL